MEAEQETELVATSRAARILGVSQNYVRLMIQKGRITAIRTELGYMIATPELNRVKAERDQDLTMEAGRSENV